MHVGFGNLGGAIAGFVYRGTDSKSLRNGHCILIGTITMSTCLCIFMTIWLRRENARRIKAYKPPTEYTREEMVAEREKGDYATFFRYVI
jgi:hypothetical protein